MTEQRVGFSTTGSRSPAPTRGRADPAPSTRTINSIGIRTENAGRLVLIAGGQDVEPGATLTLPASAVTSLVAADRKARAAWLRTLGAKGMAPAAVRDEPSVVVPASVFLELQNGLIAALDRQNEAVREGHAPKRVEYDPITGKIARVVTEEES